jgi:UDP-N-acetylglucosamine--N-acetylmuramyl-(pentapeptide) pyrophosphoryl-undecaprenol N-acetylglucosamine transferase
MGYDGVVPAQLLWAGSIGGMEQALVERARIPYRGISTGQLRAVNPLKLARNAVRMVGGIRQSLELIDSFQPDVCFVTGGYVCGPVVAACALRKVPVLIYLPDVTPGYAIRWLSKLAQRVAVTLPEAANHFGGVAPQGKAVVTGYPVRQELVAAAQNRPAARRELAGALQWQALEDADGGGQGSLPLLLIFGGSQGARAINRAAWSSLDQLLPHAAVLHVVGERDWPLYEEWARANSPAGELRQRYHPVPYLHEAMPIALAAADLTVARAGASALGEFPAAGLPAVLAPYAGVNQMDNAQALAERGAAVIVRDEELGAWLAPTVADLLMDTGKLQGMRSAMAGLARPQAAEAIAAEIMRLATE